MAWDEPGHDYRLTCAQHSLKIDFSPNVWPEGGTWVDAEFIVDLSACGDHWSIPPFEDGHAFLENHLWCAGGVPGSFFGGTSRLDVGLHRVPGSKADSTRRMRFRGSELVHFRNAISHIQENMSHGSRTVDIDEACTPVLVEYKVAMYPLVGTSGRTNEYEITFGWYRRWETLADLEPVPAKRR